MMQLPFRQLAILDPTISHPHWTGRPFGKAHLSELRQWAALAQQKGAAAAYLRIRDEALLLPVFEGLHNTFPLLVPASLSHLDIRPFAWQHTAGSRPVVISQAVMNSISCHSLEELKLAEANGFDFAFLSPIFATATHPEAKPLGLEQLQLAAAGCRLPIIALGGMDAESGEKSMAAGAEAWAAIRYFL